MNQSELKKFRVFNHFGTYHAVLPRNIPELKK